MVGWGGRRIHKPGAVEVAEVRGVSINPESCPGCFGLVGPDYITSSGKMGQVIDWKDRRLSWYEFRKRYPLGMVDEITSRSGYTEDFLPKACRYRPDLVVFGFEKGSLKKIGCKL